ncbi:hypothetical protein [Streptosporangium sp. NPDC002524]|uniref:hypothetical protein n=1 Tax=Streptosporangium sp. NPDC002524 TaxID=3154537 RepID=UPI0033217B16
MSTWEERMAQRAQARQTSALEAETEAWQEWERRAVAHGEKTMPALPGEERELEGSHAGHLEHWCGVGFRCSCGAISGVTSYIPTEEDPGPCEICKVRKIAGAVDSP